MKSMTGYGWGEQSQKGFKATVEISSVNRKQSEITISLPRELDVLEAQIRDEINKQVARGRITARISLHAADDHQAARVHVNAPLARAYVAQFRRLARDLKLAEAVSLDLVLRAPGVLQSDAESTEPEAFWPLIQRALRRALKVLVAMREREGRHLRKDLSTRIGLMRKAVARIRARAPEAQRRYREQLIERIRAAGLTNLGLEDERILKEVVFFADRSDISEELARLESHFDQYDEAIKSGEPVGRTLDFLAQEMNREINTIGSKSNNALISREVVTLKTELEKFREQAQNVE
ncbi:MAG TPA: YicC/YloC family endoribonuclease [Methylomirabilota bacterium]|nr:YicC/YloC family endoribonuclease [Methylomirabilota bacterium]